MAHAYGARALPRSPLVEELRKLALFESFSEDQLDWLAGHGTVVTLEDGARPVVEGESAAAFYVMLDGEVQVTKTVGGKQIVANTTDHPGVWMGAIPLEGFDPSPIGVRVMRAGRFLKLPPEGVQHMLSNGFPITGHLVAGVRGGTQNLEAMVRQQEKMAALGKLSAGLAHELNNPAAAGRRAAEQLREGIVTLPERAIELGRAGLSAEQVRGLSDLARDVMAKAPSAPDLSPLERSDREDDLGAWLDDHGVEDGWELAPTFAATGVDTGCLEALGEQIPEEARGVVFRYLESSLALAGLADEVERSTGRISELVGAVKSYSYMDQAAEQEVDVHADIDDTLVILKHALRGGVQVMKQYEPDLPRITAYGSELNQVWTNLIDNAADAMGGKGRLTIRTAREGDMVLVEIADDGPGIPPEIQSRIWEPFFTTKGVGDGTGLGLDAVYRIVTNRHKGEIKVISEPGDTRFQVRLPITRTQD